MKYLSPDNSIHSNVMEPKLAKLVTVKWVELKVTSPMSLECQVPVWRSAGNVQQSVKRLRNSYSMGCPPVREDNPRALASGLSYVQVDKHGITILYH